MSLGLVCTPNIYGETEARSLRAKLTSSEDQCLPSGFRTEARLTLSELPGIAH